MRRFTIALVVLTGVFLSALTGPQTAAAADATWIGNTDALWATTDNWSANPVPGTGDTATFNAGAGSGGPVITTANISLKSLVFDTSADAYTIGGAAAGTGQITLDDSGTITMNSTVANNELINAKILFGTATASSYTITNNSTTNTLRLAGAVQGGTGGTGAAKTLTITGAGDTTISGNIAKGGATALSLTKSGAGKLTLSGALFDGTNTTSSLTISSGTASLTSAVAANQLNNLTINSSTAGTFSVDGGNVLIYTRMTLGSTGTTGSATFNFSAGTVNVRCDSSSTNGNGSNDTNNRAPRLGWGGPALWNQTGGLFYNYGNSMLSIGSSNTVTMNISGGTFQFNANGDTARVWGPKMGGDAGSNVTWTIGGTNTQALFWYSSLALSGTQAGTFSTGGTTVVTLKTKGTMWIQGFTVNGGNAASYAASSFNFDGGTLKAWGGNYDMLSSSLFGGTKTSVYVKEGGAILDSAGFNPSISTALKHGGSGTDGGLTKVGSGAWTLSGSNAYNGPTTISGGTLALGAAGSINSSPTITVGGGAFYNVSAVTNGYHLLGTQTLKGTGTVVGSMTADASSHIAPGTSAGTLTVGDLTLNSALLDFDLDTPATSDLLNLGSGALALGGTSTFNFTAQGGFAPGTYPLIQYGSLASGTLSNLSFAPATLGGYNLALSSSASTVWLNVASALSQWTGAADSVWTNSDNWTGGVPDALGASAGFGTSSTGATTADLGSADRTLGQITFSNGASMTISSSGSHTLVLDNSGSNAVIKASGSHLISAAVQLNSDAAVTVTGTADLLTIGGNIADGSNGSKGLILTSSNAGSVVLAGNNTFTGDTLVNGGKLVVGSSGALLNSTVLEGWNDNVIAFGSGVTAATFGGLKGTALDLTNADGNAVRLSVGNNNASTIYTGALSGSGGLTKVGSGSLTLKYANTYAGDTVVASGTLALGAPSTLPHGSGKGNVVLDGGATAGTLDLGGFDQQINGLSGGDGATLGQILNSGTGTNTLTVGDGDATSSFAGQIQSAIALVKTGSGIQTLSGSNGYSGGTTVNNGTLGIASADALPTSRALTIAGGGHVVLVNGLSHAISLGGLTITSGAGGGAVGSGKSGYPPGGSVGSSQPLAASQGSAAPTPEPGTLVLLAAGAIAGLAAWRRKNRRS